MIYLQQASDYTEKYLHLSNIPTNYDKTNTIIFQDWYYQQYVNMKKQWKKWEPEMVHIQKRIIKANISSMDKKIFINKMIKKHKLNGITWKIKEVEELIHYAKGQGVWEEIKSTKNCNDSTILFMDMHEYESYHKQMHTEDTQCIDYMQQYRQHTYTVNGILNTNADNITILGMILDNKWTFTLMKNKIIKNLKNIYKQCMFMLYHSKYRMSAGVI